MKIDSLENNSKTNYSTKRQFVQEGKAKIEYIPVEMLHPHPDNPRKNIGDISELTESIRHSGIMQNLTVVPCTGYYFGDYTVIIGHRRLAAAKAAGLKTVPCVIAELDPKEQLGIMLAENMQRSDLTMFEQAKGMQLMLDMGESVENVAQKTGFSQSTVYSRIRLLKKFDENVFKKTEGRQVTVSEYERLYEIEDDRLRNDVLALIGTRNFNMELKKAVQHEAYLKTRKELIAALESFAKRISQKEAHKYKFISIFANKDKIPQIDPNRKYYYTIEKGRTWTELRAEFTDEERLEEERISKKERLREEKERKKAALIGEIEKRAFECRKEFVANIDNPNQMIINSMLAAAVTAINAARRNWGCWGCDIGIKPDIFGELTGGKYESNEITMDRMTDNCVEFDTKTMLYLAYSILERPSETFRDRYNRYISYPQVQQLYKHLSGLGYDVSDDEKQLLDGTHEVFA